MEEFEIRFAYWREEKKKKANEERRKERVDFCWLIGDPRSKRC